MEIRKTYNSTRSCRFYRGLLQTSSPLFNHERKIKKKIKIEKDRERNRQKKSHGEIEVKPELLQ